MTASQVTKRGPGFAGARRRAVGFLEYRTGLGTGETGGGFVMPKAPGLSALLLALPDVAERVYLLDAEGVWGSWARAVELPEGWAHAARGHHLPTDSTSTPSLRFTRPDGRALEFRNGAEWFGEEGARLGSWACASAWSMLADLLAALPVGGELLASPSQTGRDLLARLLPRGHEFPLLSDELRETIRHTAPQGRVELFPAARRDAPGLYELDARTAYGACLRSLGSGLLVHDDAPALPLDERGRLTARCRLRVRVTVPVGWAHVGIFGGPDKPYRYPRTPGETFTTWADGWEVQTGLDHGWGVEVLERVLFEQGAPLDGWARTLRQLVTKLDAIAAGTDGRELVAQLAARAVRNMLVATVGAFAQTAYKVTRSSLDAEAIPTGVAKMTRDDATGAFVWEERRALGGSAARFSHPEWAAQVWGRARVRLLSTPTTKSYPVPTGALHVPFSTVVAMRTDALYLTANPGWPDDGEWGRYRLKGASTRPRRWPDTTGKLLTARDAGRAELAALRG